VTQCDCVR